MCRITSALYAWSVRPTACSTRVDTCACASAAPWTSLRALGTVRYVAIAYEMLLRFSGLEIPLIVVGFLTDFVDKELNSKIR